MELRWTTSPGLHQVALPGQTHHLHIRQGESFDRPNQTWSRDRWDPLPATPIIPITYESYKRSCLGGNMLENAMGNLWELEACMGSTFFGAFWGRWNFQRNQSYTTIWNLKTAIHATFHYKLWSNSTYCQRILNYYISICHCLFIQYNTIQYNTIQYNTIQYIQYNTIQYNTIRYDTIRYDTIRYDTIQYNTIQYNTIHIEKERE